tara:strand:+ start:4266 stop:10625 length:6360 start_codon:yes stop_codon:yes gene_type:complete
MEAPSKPALPQVSSIFDGLSIDAVRKDPPMSVGAPYAMPTQLLVNPNTTDAMLEEQYKEISNGVPFQAVTVLGAQAGSFIRGVSPTDLGLDMVLDPKIKEEDRDYVTSRVPKPRIARAGKASMMNRLGLRDVTEIHRAGHPEMAEAALRSLVTSFTAAKEVQIASIANDDVVLEVVHHDLLPVRLERLLALVEYNRIPGMIVKNTKYDDVMADAASTGTPKPMVRRFYIPTVQDMLVALWGPDPVTGSMKLGRGASWSQGETAAAKYNGREGVAPSDSPLQALMTPEEAQAIRRNIKAFQGTNGDRVAVPDSSIGTGQDQLDLSPHGPFGYLPSSERDRYDPRGLVKRLLVPKFTLTAAEAAVTNEDRAWRKSATSMLYPELSLDDGDHVEVAHRKIVRGGPPTLAAGEPFGSERYEPADLELDEAVLSTPVGAWMADSTTDPVLDQHLDLTRFDLVRDRWRLAQMQRMYGDRATFDLTVADLREVAALGYAYDEHVAAQIKGSKEPGEAMYKTQQEIRMSRLVTPSHIGCALRASTTWGDLHFATSYQSTAEMKNDAKAKEGVDWKLVRAFADAAPKVTVPKLLAVGSHGCNAGLTNDDETTLHWRITEVGTNAVWATYREIEESLAPYSGVGDAGIPAYKLSQLLMNGKRVVSAQTDASDGVPKFYGLTSLGDKKLEPYLPGTFGTRSAQWVPETGNRETEDLTDRPTDIHCVPTVRPYAQSVGRPPPPAGAIASSVAMDVDTSAEGTRKVRMVVPKGILLFTRTEVKEGLVYHGGGLGTPRYLIGTLDAVDTKLLKPPHDVGMTLANGARAIRQANGAVTSHEASAPVFEFPLSEKGRLSDKEKDGMPVADTVEKLMEAAIHYVVYHGGYWNGDPLARSVFPNYTEELYKLDQRAALKDTLVGKAKDIVRMLTQMNSRRAPTEEHSSAARMAASSTEGSLPDSRVRIGAGFLKSLMQKAVRIGARSWKFWGDDYVPGMTEDAPPPPSLEDMDASLLAMAAFGLCCSHLGDAKLPELQMKSVPGPSAAFKRLAIIMVEDAWPVALPQLWFERGYDASYWLNCFASHALLLSAPQRKYHTSLDMMASAMIVVASAASSEYHVAHELDAGSKAAFDRPVAATRMIGLGEAQRKDLPKDSLAYHVNRIPGDYMRIARERGKSMSLSDAMFTLMMGDAARQDPLSPDGPLRFDYHTATVRAVDEPPDAKSFEVDFDAPIHFDFVVDVSVGYMHAAAAMIRVVRSFGGDMDMMDRAASFGDRRAYPTGLLVHKIAEANGVGHFLENGALWNAQTLAELAVGGLVADPDDETQAYPMWRYWGGERAQIRCAFSPLDLAFPNPSPRRASDPHSPLGFRLAGKPGVGGFSAGETRTTVAYEPENYRPLPRGLDDAGALSYDFRRVSDVPMLHMIDQHAYPGVAHLWTTWPAWLKEVWPQDSFRARFKFLFHTVTGWNPRNRSHALQEPKELKHAPDLATWSQMDDFRKHQTKVLFARAAQKIVLASQRQLPRTDVPGWEMTEKVTLTFPVDHGVLAGGVGVVGKLRVKPPSKRAGGAVKGEASVEGAEEFFRVVAYRTGTPTPTKPANALFVEESVGDFSQIGLPSDQTLLEYKLSVSIGMDSPDPVVLDYVSTSTRGAKPKLFTITKAVRDAVVEAFYEGSAIEGYAFASEVLPKFHRAHFVTEAQSMKPGVGLTPGWYLTTTHKPHPTFLTTARGTALKQWTYFDSSTGRHEWCYDCHVATLDVALTSPLESTVPAFSFEFEGIDDPNDAVVSTYLRRERNVHVLHGMPTMCDGYEERIKEICHALHDVASLQSPGGRVVLERLRSFLDRAISEIAMPVPSVTGGRAADSLEPAPGDWLVWRGLMYISFYATGAFVCKQIPKFEVKSKLLMREVIRIVDAVIEDLSEDAQNTDSFEWKGILNVMELQFGQPVPPTGEVNYPSPTEVQKLAVGGLLRRDGVPLVDRYDGEWPQPLVKARPPVRSLAELPPVQRAHFLAMDTVRLPLFEHSNPTQNTGIEARPSPCVAGHGEDRRGHLLRAQVARAHAGRAARALGVPQGHCREHQGRAGQVGPRRVRACGQAGQVLYDHRLPLQHCDTRGLFKRHGQRAPDDALPEGLVDVLHL